MAAVPQSSFDRSKKVIIVVDDDADLGEILALLLQIEGYTSAHCALTGGAAIALVASLGADALLLDFMLPDMTGGEVGLHLRCQPAMKDLVIFMCTSTPEEVVRPVFDGYQGFFRKPVSHTRLIRELDAALAVHH